AFFQIFTDHVRHFLAFQILFQPGFINTQYLLVILSFFSVFSENTVLVSSIVCCIHRPNMVAWTPYCEYGPVIVWVSLMASKATKTQRCQGAPFGRT
ncbi:MAG: hypothetical protein WCR46_24620, partial [Deltaproteobacteria bacterium]